MIHSARNKPRKWLSCSITLCLLGASHGLPAAERRLVAGNENRPSTSKASFASQQTSPSSQQSSALSGARSSVSLAPAVVMVKCKFSQSYTQVLTLFNQKHCGNSRILSKAGSRRAGGIRSDRRYLDCSSGNAAGCGGSSVSRIAQSV